MKKINVTRRMDKLTVVFDVCNSDWEWNNVKDWVVNKVLPILAPGLATNHWSRAHLRLVLVEDSIIEVYDGPGKRAVLLMKETYFCNSDKESG